LATFGDQTGELPFSDITLEYADADIWNEVKLIYSDTGNFVIADDANSQSQPWGLRALTRSIPIFDSGFAQLYADFIVELFKNPKLHLKTLPLKPMNLRASLFTQIAERELGDRVTIKLTPPVGSRITRDVWIAGIAHNITADDWTTTWTLADANWSNVLGFY